MPTAKNLIKAQLRRYYRTQGVGIRRSEKRVKADFAAYERYVAHTYHCAVGVVRQSMPRWYTQTPTSPLEAHLEGWAAMFPWHKTPEGHSYWARRFGFF